ncbi:DEAD/DEAH box helicase [Anaeromyxobacter sp. Fw109-5]|uniref:DEAD/DEAH box helicase n=1 Tax=Anaeromyxobacter sp. (strain Fw109-5) TaxID=404589 RepID=UPI0000ED7FBC|nr:DEAD/DEAH box helicase [Anaeromyxobacter sp. Fw109-5]ABS27113.1 DEAD/DEAH box helicase domain protein [Anaeromyxobacter sp. Fw109-5]
MNTFSSVGAHPALLPALDRRGYLEPTSVQAAVLEPAHRGQDLLVSSRTGSGKTVAFGLALAETLLGDADAFGEAGPPGALVVAPTRELAVQVQRELAWLFADAGGRVASCVGGMDPRREARALAEGTHVVVGTPGRLVDHLERGALDLSALRALVLDEADEMLDMGFREELEKLLGAAPPDRRTVLFSATLPRPILELAKRYTRDASRIAATPAGEAHADIAYRAHVVAPREREHAVVNVLREAEPPSALVFRATREAVQHTAVSLGERGFEVVAISGELTQAERTRALKSLRDGRARVLVATDVAARGLDLPGIALVLHADLPRDAEALQHRSGRTGRAGRKGVAVLLAAPPERYRLERMLRDAGVRAEWTPVPTAEAIRAGDAERLAADVVALAGDAAEEDLAAARRLAESRSALELAVALVRRDRSRRPAPEELPETARAAREVPARAEKRAPRAGPPANAVWFRLSLGRARQADPRWVLPLLCRRGGVTRDEIGKIVIQPEETRFEVAADAAQRFLRAARRPDPRMPDARIELLGTNPRAGEPRHAPRPVRAEGARRHERADGEPAPPRRSAPAAKRRGPR